MNHQQHHADMLEMATLSVLGALSAEQAVSCGGQSPA